MADSSSSHTTFGHSVDHSEFSSSKGASLSDQDEDALDLRFILVGQKCHRNVQLNKALDECGAEVIQSDTGYEFMNECEDDTVFVLDNFDGTIFRRLHKAGCRIMGPPAIIQTVQTGEVMPCKTRPLYSVSMAGLIICFTGIKNKEELTRLVELIHHMGGSIRKDFSSRVTHLIANCTSGEKYRLAVSKGVPVMTDDWVYQCWEERENPHVTAINHSMMNYKLCPFSFSVLAFLGFSRDESLHMEDITAENGGSCVEAGAPSCTHLVVDEHSVKQIPFEINQRLHVVKSEWFWASIQMDACAEESMYAYHTPMPMETPIIAQSKETPKTVSGGGSRSRKRKRLKENLAQLASEGEIDTPMYKRRSSEMARISFSASFLDDTADTPGTHDDLTSAENHTAAVPHNATTHTPPTSSKETCTLSARRQTVMELFQTEKNYVGILHTIIKVFKEEIENPNQPGGPLLDLQESKTIFGGIPPIYDVHVKMRDELGEIVSNWREDIPVADVILKHFESLGKCYPNFVNYFERTKETIGRCDRSKPRFHAFLKVCQGKPECGRQSLRELLIRPVQRLPSIMLLLKEIRKRTEPSCDDYSKLAEAFTKLEEVMMHINEDKRKTEGHQTMFDIINVIENCPANLLSAHRRFVMKVDVIELTSELSSRGDHLTLFIFSDSLAICKRRGKLPASYKSPAAPSHGSKTPQRAFKHLTVLNFSTIKRVVDVSEASDCRHTFALIIKQLADVCETLYAFTIEDDSAKSKEEFLMQLSKTICDNMCRPDYETLMTRVDSQVLSLDTSDIGNGTLSRAASKFGKRVSKAFSFNKTPRTMKRAISSMTQMMSPFSTLRRDSSMSSRSSLTPRRGGTNLIDMKLASSNDLTTAGGEDPLFQENTYSELVDQMSLKGTPSLPRKRRDTLAMLPESDVDFTTASVVDYSTPKKKRRSVLNPLSWARQSVDNVACPDIGNHGNKPSIKAPLTPVQAGYTLRPALYRSCQGYATIATPLRTRRYYRRDPPASPSIQSEYSTKLQRNPSTASTMSTLSTVSEFTYPSSMNGQKNTHFL